MRLMHVKMLKRNSVHEYCHVTHAANAKPHLDRASTRALMQAYICCETAIWARSISSRDFWISCSRYFFLARSSLMSLRCGRCAAFLENRSVAVHWSRIEMHIQVGLVGCFLSFGATTKLGVALLLVLMKARLDGAAASFDLRG